MFCKNCGYTNADGVRFCAKCGSTLEAAPVAPTAPAYNAPAYNAPAGNAYSAPAGNAYNAPAGNAYSAPAGNPYGAPAGGAYPGGPAGGADVKKVLPIAAIGVVAAVVVILLFSSLLGRSAKSTASKAVSYALDGNFYKISKLYHKEVIKEKDWDDDGFKDDCKEAKEEYKEYIEELEDEEGKVKFSHSIKDQDDITGDELDDIQDYYEDEFDLKVKKAKTIEIELCVKIDGEENETDMEITVVKIGGKWYLADPDDLYYLADY